MSFFRCGPGFWMQDIKNEKSRRPRKFSWGCFIFPCLGSDNVNKNTALPSNHVSGQTAPKCFCFSMRGRCILITVHVSFDD